MERGLSQSRPQQAVALRRALTPPGARRGFRRSHPAQGDEAPLWRRRATTPQSYPKRRTRGSPRELHVHPVPSFSEPDAYIKREIPENAAESPGQYSQLILPAGRPRLPVVRGKTGDRGHTSCLPCPDGRTQPGDAKQPRGQQRTLWQCGLLTDGGGLLLMCHQSSIDNQFGFVQRL